MESTLESCKRPWENWRCKSDRTSHTEVSRRQHVVEVRVAGALGKIGKPAVESLLRALEDDDWELREGAVMALGAVGDPMTVEPLVHCLEDDCETVRFYVVEALGKIGNPSAVEPLLKALRDENKEVRLSAAEDLGWIGGWNKVAERIIRAALELLQMDHRVVEFFNWIDDRTYASE